MCAIHSYIMQSVLFRRYVYEQLQEYIQNRFTLKVLINE